MSINSEIRREIKLLEPYGVYTPEHLKIFKEEMKVLNQWGIYTAEDFVHAKKTVKLDIGRMVLPFKKKEGAK